MMTRKMGTLVLAGVCAVLLSGCNWAMYGYGPSHTHYNPGESKIGVDNVATLLTKWSATTAGDVESSPAIVGDVVYVGSHDGDLHALDAETGDPVWTTTIGGLVSSSPAVVNGVVFVGSDRSKLHALDASNGAPLWSADTSSGVESSPTVANGVVYVGSDDGTVYAFDAAGTTGCSGTPKTCEPLWTAATGSFVFSAVTVVKGVVYVGSGDGTVYAFDAAGGTGCSGSPKTCAPLWTAPTGSFIGSSPAVANGIVYVGADDGNLYAFDAAGSTGCSGSPKTCAPLWTAGAGSGVGSSPAVANGVVYVGSFDGKLYAFDATGSTGCSGSPKTCVPLWQYVTAEAVTSSPAVANGVVYVGSEDHRLYAFDAAGERGCSGTPKTCASLWTATTGGFVVSSPAVANGVVYVGSDDGNLYAFGLPKIRVVERHSHLPSQLAPGASNSNTAPCEDDEVAVGGGYIAEIANDGSVEHGITAGQTQATPDGGTDPTAWTAFVTNHSADFAYFGARALCASAGSATLHVVERADAGGVTLAPGASGSSTATCHAGEVAVAGGFVGTRNSDGSVESALGVGQSEATPDGSANPTEWTASATNNDSVAVNFAARVTCATSGSATLRVVERMHRRGVTLVPGASGSSSASCRPDEVATGGGFVARHSSDGSIDSDITVGLDSATPDGAANLSAWTAVATNTDTDDVNVAARVMCVS